MSTVLELHISPIRRNNSIVLLVQSRKSRDQDANVRINGQFINIAPQTPLNVDRGFLASIGSEAHARQATIHLGY
jgi:hypothetical protein